MGAFNDDIRLGASAASDYEIEKSLRFEYGSSDTTGPYLTRTPSSSGNLKTFTISVWIKKCTTPGAEGFADAQTIISNGGGGGGSYAGRLAFDTSDRLNWVQNNPAPTQHIQLQTSRKFRDCSSWYHIVLIQDTTQAASADRARLYVNGVKETVFDATTYPTQDYDGYFNNNTAHNIGSNAVWGSLSTRYGHFNGYMAEFHFLDGTVKEPSNFGKTNASTGQWIPTEYTGGSYGTNGFYLQFLDNSGTTATTLGKDTSGQTNNWTPTDFSVTAGAGNDSVTDTPTNNYCTLNPLFNAQSSLEPVITDGNLSSNNGGGGDDVTQGTIGVSSGKWYFEFTPASVSGNTHFVGWMLNEPDDGAAGASRLGGLFRSNGYVFDLTGSSTDLGTTYASGNVIGCALDADAGKVYFAVNNTWINSGNPPAGSGAAFTYTAGPALFPGIGFDNTSSSISATVNFGQQAFSYTPPTGFEKLCKANLPDSTIKKGTDYFNTVLYTGTITDTSTQTVSGVGFQPDLTWIKRRDGANSSQLVDDVRGVGKWLESSGTAAEQTSNTNGVLTTFNADGFVLTGGSTNANLCCESGYTYASWNWKESASAGFDIVSYTGTGSAQTVSHSLGVAPEMMIIKNRDSTYHWPVYHHNLTDAAENHLTLSDTDAAAGGNTWWNDTAPTSSVFTVLSANETNKSSDDYIAYLFASVEGYSKVGSFIGNGNADGTFIYTGFKTAWVMTKRSVGGSSNWNIFDKKRPGHNVTNDRLFANITNAETDGSPTDNQVDLLSNGFKMRGNNADTNASGSTYVYLALAETPFKYANAR